MGIETYSPTAASNTALFPENMLRSAVNNGMRQVQADLRSYYNDPGWIQYGDGDGAATITQVSGSSFLVAGADVTTVFHAGRAIKVSGSSTGTVYGTIRTSSFSTDTTVHVDLNDTGALVSEALTVWIASQPNLTPQTPVHARPSANLLANGQFVSWSRGTTLTSTSGLNNDAAEVADDCYLLSDGNDIADVSKETTTKPLEAPACIKLDTETANKKFGLLFPLSAADSKALVGGVASLSFKARKGASNATLETIRASIITWSSTADAYTLDVVSTWQAAGTNPTLVSNWTYENTPFNIVVQNVSVFKTYRIQNIAIDTASGANVAVWIWVDDTDATVGDLLYIADVKLQPGAVATEVDRETCGIHEIRTNGLVHIEFPAVATTSGTAHTLNPITLPSGVVEARIQITGLSANGVAPFLIQIGDSGGTHFSAYSSSTTEGGAARGEGFVISGAAVAANLYYGEIILSRVSTVNWVSHGCVSSSAGGAWASAGAGFLDTELTSIVLTTIGSVDTFDAGSVRLSVRKLA